MSNFFTKDHLWSNTPHFISDTIEEMMYEREHSGVETTPDETSLLIEAFYKWVSRIWIAEAIHAEQTYPNLFVDIFGMGLLRFFTTVCYPVGEEPLVHGFPSHEISAIFSKKKKSQPIQRVCYPWTWDNTLVMTMQPPSC